MLNNFVNPTDPKDAAQSEIAKRLHGMVVTAMSALDLDLKFKVIVAAAILVSMLNDVGEESPSARDQMAAAIVMGIMKLKEFGWDFDKAEKSIVEEEVEEARASSELTKP